MKILFWDRHVPDKIRYNMKYIDNRCLKEYFKIIFLTLMKIVK